MVISNNKKSFKKTYKSKGKNFKKGGECNPWPAINPDGSVYDFDYFTAGPLSVLQPNERVTVQGRCYNKYELCRWIFQYGNNTLPDTGRSLSPNDRAILAAACQVHVPPPPVAVAVNHHNINLDNHMGQMPVYDNGGRVVAYVPNPGVIDDQPQYINNYIYPAAAPHLPPAAAAHANMPPVNNNYNPADDFNPQHQYPQGDPNNDNQAAMYDGGISQFRKRKFKKNSIVNKKILNKKSTNKYK